MSTNSARGFLLTSFLVVATIFLLFYGLSMAKGVLAPIFLAVLLAMVLSPVANFLERKGMKRGWASFLSDLIFVLFICGILIAIGAEVKRVASNANQIEQRLSKVYSQMDSFVENKFGYHLQNPFSGNTNQNSGQNSTQKAPQGQEQSVGSQAQQSGSGGSKSKSGSSMSSVNSMKDFLTKALTWTFSSLTTFLLIVVYIFFMLLFRDKFEKGILYFVPERQRDKGEQTISEILKDAQQYLFGHVILITVLTVFYSIGFFAAGMKGAFTTALLASVLTLVPYVGTMIGNVLAIGLAFITTGNMSAVWIVVGTVAVGQFIESYFLEPYVVGKRMNVNPLFTILSVTIGAAVWGIIGMIVFLPLFSFIKAIADKVPVLKPIGYFIGKEDTSE